MRGGPPRRVPSSQTPHVGTVAAPIDGPSRAARRGRVHGDVASAAGQIPEWVRSMIVGCLWYVALELAWDSIERRNGVARSSALELRRTNEVAVVVVVALAVSVGGYALSFLHLPRNLAGQGAILIALFAVLLVVGRFITATRTHPPEADDM